MARRQIKTYRGQWTFKDAVQAACDLFCATGSLQKTAICTAIRRSKSWGSRYLDLDELLEEVLRQESWRLRERCRTGDPLPQLLARYANPARERARRGELLHDQELRAALKARLPQAPWLWGALLGLAATLPRDQVAEAVEKVLWNE